MAKRRDKIRMTEDEVRAFIEKRKSLQVATLNRDGSPHLTTLWFAVVDGDLVFETYTKSQKILNLKRDPRISVLLEAGETYDKLQGVSISGHAELHSDPEDVHKLAFEVMKRNQTGVPPDALEQVARQLANKRTAVVVKAEKVVSWDHTKLGGSY